MNDRYVMLPIDGLHATLPDAVFEIVFFKTPPSHLEVVL